jgi:broad specificity phosphatase PhoE
MKLIAIRHGETAWNLEGRRMGQLDSPLTARGVDQGEALARRLARTSFEAIYTSDLGRAVQTAELIARATGRPIVIEPGLRERHMGIFQGLTDAEAAARFPDEVAAARRIGPAYEAPGSESIAHRVERAVRVLSDLAARHPDATLVAVTHNGFLTGFFEHVLALAPGHDHRYAQRNCAYNTFHHDRGHWRLETWNDTSHLDAPAP